MAVIVLCHQHPLFFSVILMLSYLFPWFRIRLEESRFCELPWLATILPIFMSFH